LSKFSSLLLSQAGFVFLFIFIFLYLIFSPSKEDGAIKRRTGLYSSFPPKTIAYIFLAAGSVSYFVSKFSYSGLTSALVFISVLGLAPLLLDGERKRNANENLFSDVILFCQNMGMLLKQSHNVYSSLLKASEDLEGSLKEDAVFLLNSLEEGKDKAIESMAILEKNYPYSCIRNLDIIILHMFFETANVDDSLLATYQDDVTALERDVRQNKEKRKSLRMSYIIISLGSIIAYWFFVRSLSGTFDSIFNNDFYRISNAVYVFAAMLSFFFVDRFFNMNTTKE